MSASEGERRGAWQGSPYHSNSFFTGGFDERKMEDVLEELRSSQGKLEELPQVESEEAEGEEVSEGFLLGLYRP